MPSRVDKPWSGRFTVATDERVERFTASVRYDRRLYHYDIIGSIAHARMLMETGVLSREDAERIVAGLQEVRAEIENGELKWSDTLEDVHMNIEARLVEKIGATGKRLHTARSRNDQVATGLRLFLRAEIDAIVQRLHELMSVLAKRAEHEAATVMPGMTHLQNAQPTTFGHHLMAWLEMLDRDRERLADCRRRVNVSPLGAAALAGTGFPVDRARTAQLLDFSAPARNSLDTVSDRDFCIEFASACALIMMHLSRFSEELVIWMSAPFGFVGLPDACCTGSSIMPQKKNPDVPELVRGKTGRVYGHLMALLTLMKGQPLAYNRDNQEDKEAVFDTVDTVKDCLDLYVLLIRELHVDRERMRQAAGQGYPTATDLADCLAGRGVPFREAHALAGRAVREAQKQGCELTELKPEELGLGASVDPGLMERLSLEGAVGARDHDGGTAPKRVRAAARRAQRMLKETHPPEGAAPESVQPAGRTGANG